MHLHLHWGRVPCPRRSAARPFSRCHLRCVECRSLAHLATLGRFADETDERLAGTGEAARGDWELAEASLPPPAALAAIPSPHVCLRCLPSHARHLGLPIGDDDRRSDRAALAFPHVCAL